MNNIKAALATLILALIIPGAQAGTTMISGSQINPNTSIMVSSITLTASGSTQGSIKTSSSIYVSSGGVTAPWFSGMHYGDGTPLTGVVHSTEASVGSTAYWTGSSTLGSLNLLRDGPTSLTTISSFSASALSIGVSTLVVNNGRVGIGTMTPVALFQAGGMSILATGELQSAGPGKGTVTGNARGGYGAVDLQVLRNAATQVASGDASVISGGRYNAASTLYGGGTVSGGEYNAVSGYFDNTIGGGVNNTAYDNNGSSGDGAGGATVGGGGANAAICDWCTVAGGHGNTASRDGAAQGGSFVGGGSANTASGSRATIAGGYGNAATGAYSFVGGGGGNGASGLNAVIPGGWQNTANGGYSFSGGRRAHSDHDGAFVWSDGYPSGTTHYYDHGENTFNAHNQGGAYFDGVVSTYSIITSSGILVGGSVVASGFKGDGSDLTKIPVKIVTPSNGALGQGATFYSFISDGDIHLSKMSVILRDAGEDAGSTEWRCGGASYLSVTTDISTVIGLPQMSVGDASFSLGQSLSCAIFSSTQPITPTGVIELVYTKN